MLPAHLPVVRSGHVSWIRHIPDPSNGIWGQTRRANNNVKVLLKVFTHRICARTERSNNDDVLDISEITDAGEALALLTFHERNNLRLESTEDNIESDGTMIPTINNDVYFIIASDGVTDLSLWLREPISLTFIKSIGEARKFPSASDVSLQS